MSGTYNEVQVKKLGSKSGRQTKPKNNQSGLSRHTSSSTSTEIPYNRIMQSNSQISHHETHKSKPNPASQAAAWPQSLSSFVNTSFERSEMLPAAQKAVFNEQIQSLIYTAARENKLWTNKWELQKLPVFDATQQLCLFQDTAEARHQAQVETHKETIKSQKEAVKNQKEAAKSQKEVVKSQKEAQKAVQKPTKSSKQASKRPATFDSGDRKRQRAERFQDNLQEPFPSSPSVSGNQNTTHVVGTSTDLEKRYLRLTSEPDPAKVRPKPVLKNCLAYVVEKYRSTGASYSYINDQLKAIRQDLTVQHIKGDLAVKVYETHGRIAIENNDLGEFNQCQAQLKHLYDAKEKKVFYKKTYEFKCYRILYLLLTSNYADINLTRLELLDADSDTIESNLASQFLVPRKCVYKALELMDVVILGNYDEFFKIFQWFKGLDCMEGAFHMLDQFMASKQRVLALNTMCKTFKKLPLTYIQESLALDPTSSFFSDFSLQGYISDTNFDCSAARLALQAIVDQGKFKKVDIKGQV